MDRREYQRLWVAKRRASYFENKVCVNCNSEDNLQLHHINPFNKVDHRIWSWSEERRNLELENCCILCKLCHINEHRPILHGKLWTYRKYKCRCEPCKQAKKDSRVKWG